MKSVSYNVAFKVFFPHFVTVTRTLKKTGDCTGKQQKM